MVPDLLTKGRTTFPFSAIVGMEDVKTALLCLVVCPDLRNLLILGASGAGKSVMVRSLGGASWGRPIIDLPIRCSPEQVFGGLDIEQSLSQGKACVSPGILMRAERKMLYADDVNFMEKGILLGILEAAVCGENVVEREGVSFQHTCDFNFVGSMSPLERPLDPHLLDRFDMCVVPEFVRDEEECMEVVRRRMLFEKDPVAFCDLYQQQEAELALRVSDAAERFEYVSISDELLEIIVNLCNRMGVQGHRGDIALANVSRALAALAGRDELQRVDLQKAATLCLRHRQQPPSEWRADAPRERKDRPERGDERLENDRSQDQGKSEGEIPTPPVSNNTGRTQPDMVYSVGETFEIIDFLKGWSPDQERSQSRHGRREKVLSLDCTGRYARSRIIEDRPHDIALDASIRAAAPYQIHRDRRGLAIALEPQDLREKVRERGRGTTILFLVDASGSIGARRRMVMVKGAILSMLNEAYLKRDRIGLMAFRREAVELLLPPTRSVSLAYKKLGELPTGGRTPLSLALTRAHNLMLAQARLFQGESCHVILVTDGRANVPLKDEEAMSEVLALAKNVRSPSYKWTVVDTGSSHLGMDNALRLAEALDAAYFRLDDLSAERLAERVRVVSA